MEALGITALGVFLGYMTWYFVTRVTDKPIDSFAAVSAVLFGGVVLSFIGGATTESRWWYPIGLVLEWLIYVGLRWSTKKEIPTVM